MIAKIGKTNKRLKVWRAVGAGKERGCFFMEHTQAVLESLDGDVPPAEVLISEERYQEQPAYWEDLASRGSRWFRLPQEQLDRVVSVRVSGGLCGLFRSPTWDLTSLLERSFVMVCWKLQDPGNLGTLVRSCAALTNGALLQLGGCCPWSAKVARASAGSLLRIPVRWSVGNSLESEILDLKTAGFQLYSLAPRADHSLFEVAWGDKAAMIVGNETHGIAGSIQKFTNTITVPMQNGVESLNAGVAGSLACYEWCRAGQKGG